MSQYTDGKEDAIDLGALFRFLLRRWWFFLIFSIVGGGGCFWLTVKWMTPVYQSSAMLHVLASTTNITSLSDMTLSDELAADFVILAKSNDVLDAVSKRIKKESGREFTRAQINGMVSVSSQASRMLVFTAVSADPETAALVANAVAEEMIEQIAEITQINSSKVVREAEVSRYPVSPDRRRNIYMGIMVGMIIAGAFLTVRFLLNDHIKTEKDVEKYLGLPTLALIPKKKTTMKKIVTLIRKNLGI